MVTTHPSDKNAQAPGAATAAVSITAADLDPLVASLGRLLGLLTPNGDQLDLNLDWFQHPVQQSTAGVKQNGAELVSLFSQLLGEAGGNALGIPVTDPALLGTWYPVSSPGQAQEPNGLYAVAYPVDATKPAGAQVFGLGALYGTTIDLGAAASVGPSAISIKAFGMLPLVQVGDGAFDLVLGTAGFPLSLGIAIESPQGPMIAAAGVSFVGVKSSASIDVAAPSAVSVSTVILQLQLPGEAAPQDRTLTQLANISGDELLATASSLALAALGSALGASPQLQFLLPVVGLSALVPGNPTALPLLDWVGLVEIALAGGNVSAPFIDWAVALVSDGAVLGAWLSALSGLIGVAAPTVTGAGTRQSPLAVAILSSASAGALSVTIGSSVTAAGVRQLYPGLELTAAPVKLGGTTLLQLEAAIELAELDLVTGGSVSYAGPSSLLGSANLALVNADAAQPLFSGAVAGLQYTFGALRAGVQIAGTLQVVPYCELTGVQTPNGNYDVLDLTQPGTLLQTALNELVGDIEQTLAALLGIGADATAPFGSQLAALIGFAPPALPDGVQWPASLAPPLSASQLLNTLQNPIAAIGGYYAQLFQGTVDGKLPFYYLVGELATLLQQVTGAIAVQGSGSAVDPWRVALADTSLPVALTVWAAPAPGGGSAQRLTFGLDLTPPLVLPSGPQLALDVRLDAFSLDLATAAPFSAGNPLLLPSVGLALSLPAGFTTPPVFGASVKVTSASLSVGWSRADGFGWSMLAETPALVVGGTTLAVGESLDFDDSTSLEALVTQEAATFAPILTGLLGIFVGRLGSPVGTAFNGLFGLLPNLQPYLPAGLTWPATMPTLALTSFSDPIGALKAEAAALFSNDANARAAMTLLAWALQPAGQPVPTLAGSGTFEDPLQVPLGFASAIGLRVWYDVTAQSVGIGLGRNQTVALPLSVSMNAVARLDIIEIALGATPITDGNPVPGIALSGDFALSGISVGDTTISGVELGVRFGFTGGTFTVTPLFDLAISTGVAAARKLRFTDYQGFVAAGATDLQQAYLTELNAAVQTVIASATSNPTFAGVYTLCELLGVALVPSADNNQAYGIDPNGFTGLFADPVTWLGTTATAILQSPSQTQLLYGTLESLLGLPPLSIPTPLLEVFAAMGYVAPAELAFAPMPDALVQLFSHPVQTLTDRFVALVTSSASLAALVGQLTQNLAPIQVGRFWASITGGRYVTVTTTAPAGQTSHPYAIGNLCLLSGALSFDLLQQLVGAQASFYFPAVGLSIVPEVQYSVASAPAKPLQVRLTWGDGLMPAAAPLTVYPFSVDTFIQQLSVIAPAQALSIFVSQVIDDQLLATYPLAQVAFSALGLAFQDAAGKWHLKSLLGLFTDPLGWLLSDGVFGADGDLNLAQLAKTLAAIPAAKADNGIAVAPIAGGIQVSGLPYNVQLAATVDLTAKVFTLSASLASPLSLANGGARFDVLSLGLSLGANYQPGFVGDVSLSGDVGLANRVFASFGYAAHTFALSVGEEGAGSPVLQLLPFDGWVALVKQAARIAIQQLLQQLTSTLLDALAQSGAAAFVTRLRSAAGLLDVAALVTALSSIEDPAALLQAALDWLLARVAPANIDNTTTALSSLFTSLGISGLTATSGLIRYTPSPSIPVTVLVGAQTIGQSQQLGLWLALAPPPLSCVQIAVDQTGIGFDLAKPTEPIFTFGLHVSVPIAGQTGPELDFIYDGDAQQFQLGFDPQGGGSPLAVQLYPQLFAPTGPTSAAIESWLLQILLQLLPRYISIVVLNTSTVKAWLDAPLVAGGPKPGPILVASQLLVASDGIYELNSFAALTALSPLTFLGGFLKGLLASQLKVLSLGTAGGVWLEPNPALADSFGVRVTAPNFVIPSLPNIVLQLGPSSASEVAWIANAGGGAPSNPGISVYVPIDPNSLAPSFADLQLNLINVGLDIVGANQSPLVSLSRFTLGSLSPRVLLELTFAGGKPSVTFGAALGLEELAFALSPATLPTQGNAVVQNVLGSGTSDSTPAAPPPTNPSFSATVAYVSKLWVNLQGPDGANGVQVLIPVQRSFGPLHVNDVGFGWNDSAPSNPLLDLQLDGGVTLAGLDVEVQGLVVKVPVTQPTDFSAYDLELAGLDVTFSGGGISIAGGLLKQDNPLQYIGTALIQVGSAFSVAALGAYAVVEDAPSLFVFASLDMPLGGPPAFFVTGLAGGFSYNRGLKIPAASDVQSYPLVQAAMQPSTFFGPSGPTPTNALEKLAEVVYPEVGEYWVAAGIKFTSYELISSFALLSVLFGRSFQINLIGASVMTMPPLVSEEAALAYIEMGLVVSFDPSAGSVSAQAQLTPNSFVLSHDAKLTGGFAFALWYAGANAGDFVVTFGGYHPAFDPPPYYPTVPRLGLDWAISRDPDIAISGDAYFALTPSAVMAGTHLSLLFDAGPLRAWLVAAADFILSWKPFFFAAEIAINVGVSFQTTIAGVSLTLTVSLGCELAIHGPPTGGQVGVDWYVISFSIPFGSQDTTPDAPFEQWTDFATAMLPKPTDAPNAPDSSSLMLVPLDASLPQQVLKVCVAAGQIGNDAVTGWLIQPYGFTLRVDSAVPATAGAVTGTALPAGPAMGVRPMNIQNVTSTLTVKITTAGGAPVALGPAQATIAPVLSGAPEGLWAQSALDPDATPTAAFIPNAMLGATITGDQIEVLDPVPPLSDPPMDLSVLQWDELGPLPLPLAATPYPPSAPIAQGNNFATLMATVMSAPVVSERDAIYTALLERDIAATLDPSLSVLASSATSIYLAPPVLAQVGFDLTSSSSSSLSSYRRGGRPLATKSVAPLLPAVTAPSLLGRVVRYRLPGEIASHDGVLLGWSRRSSGRWVDADDGQLARRSLGAQDTSKATGPSRRESLLPGSASVWQLDPDGASHVMVQGSLSLHLAAFDVHHRLLTQQVLPPLQSLALPRGTATLVATGVGGQGLLGGWQADSRLLQVNGYYLVGDGCLVRPQALTPRRRKRRQWRRGIVDAAGVLEGCRVSGTQAGHEPGWIETILPRTTRSIVLLHGGELPEVAIAVKAEPDSYVEYQRPTALAQPTRHVAFFDLPQLAADGQGGVVSVLVHRRSFGDLRGVFASGSDAGKTAAGWKDQRLTPPGIDPRGERPPASTLIVTTS
jgi:hypothetical protein